MYFVDKVSVVSCSTILLWRTLAMLEKKKLLLLFFDGQEQENDLNETKV